MFNKVAFNSYSWIYVHQGRSSYMIHRPDLIIFETFPENTAWYRMCSWKCAVNALQYNWLKYSQRFIKIFERYQVFVHNFPFQNFSIFPLYIILIRRIATFSRNGIDKFWSRGICTVWTQKSYKENHQYSQRYLVYTTFSL